MEEAYFKPIQSELELATDESKLESEKRNSASGSNTILKPTPVIFVNDSELKLSPLSPTARYLGSEMGSAGAVEFPDPTEEVRKILAGKLQLGGSGEGEQREIISDSRCSTPGTRSRRESITQLQRLQQQTKVPKLGGKVRV